MPRVQDEFPFHRNERAVILRIGTVASVSADAKHLNVDVPGGTLTDVPMTTAITSPATQVGKSVAVLLDRDAALAIGIIA